ncbi:hypothetical protein LIER_00496 [Lithospermum erythrorhizon]|uniref:Uncharacterized protein n=1 Tax=Lithospermum erythrorhizon TaxID=34254 RepID=A0AAV3NIC3_LITER
MFQTFLTHQTFSCTCIMSNMHLPTYGNLFSPIGFDIIFPGMIQHARSISLDLHIQLDMLNILFHKRDLELHWLGP